MILVVRHSAQVGEVVSQTSDLRHTMHEVIPCPLPATALAQKGSEANEHLTDLLRCCTAQVAWVDRPSRLFVIYHKPDPRGSAPPRIGRGLLASSDMQPGVVHARWRKKDGRKRKRLSERDTPWQTPNTKACPSHHV